MIELLIKKIIYLQEFKNTYKTWKIYIWLMKKVIMNVNFVREKKT